ncbi:hypothetical protein CRC_01736 [Cylindrospermopsis raciborskii CS-505]|uniref:Uncharacterized protein n=2 Tax=Cylindrospermopsis raciborskii TaxID=77022 RepID=A0A853MDH3_9CYAN|nr:hypothetical protein CRC_01736 [Cylindrospermopsis raciborskii CS-505]OBU75218.1 hypothetical protein A9P98_02015 [Cylindrospermopsis raciborskii CS-505]
MITKTTKLISLVSVISLPLVSLFIHNQYTSGQTPTISQLAQVKSIWQRFSSQEGKFSVLFPGTPRLSQQKMTSDNGELQVNLFTVNRPQEEAKYTVAYIDYPAQYIQLLRSRNLVEQAIEQGKSTALERVRGTIVSEEKKTLGDNVGIEVNYTTPAGKVVKQRVFLIDNRFYQITAETTQKRQRFLTRSMQGFCDSFKLLP